MPVHQTPLSRRIPASNKPRAFNLVELVIVIVIIGIIAAIAVPRVLTGTIAGSAEAALIRDLNAMRRAIETYAGEHNSNFPGAKADGIGGSANSELAFINQLTLYSNEFGGCSATASSAHPYGPYLERIPKCPIGPGKGKGEIAIDTSNSLPLVTGADEAWVYNPLTGKIIANSDDPNAAGTRTFDEY